MLRTILKNFLALLFGRFTALGIGALVTIILARALGVEDYGVFIATLAAAELFAAFLDLGLTRILVKEGAADRSRVSAHLGNILLVKAILAVLVFGGMHFFALRLGWMTPLFQLAILLGLCKIADSFALMFEGVYQVFQRMEYSAVILVVGRLGLLAAVFAGQGGGRDLLYYGWAYFAVSLATALTTSVIVIGRFAKPRWGAIPLRSTVGREGIWFALAAVIFTATVKMDLVILREWAGGEEGRAALGLYAAATRVLLVFTVLPQVLQASLLPVIFDLGRNARDRLAPFYSEYMHRSLVLALPIILFACFFPKPLVLLLFGADFLKAADYLPWLSFVLLLRFVSFAAGNVLTAIDRQRDRTTWAAVGLGASISTMILLVPQLGPMGCVWGMIAGEGSMVLLNLTWAARAGFRPRLQPLIRTLLAAIPAALMLWVIAAIWSPPVLPALVLTGAAALGALFLTRSLRPGDLKNLLGARR